MKDTVRLKGEGDKLLNVKNITGWQLFVAKPKAPIQLVVKDISLLPADETKLDKIIDRYGQSTRSQWPGKIENDDQLKTNAGTQEVTPAANDNLNIYGGWEKGPQLKATGFFRTERVDGKWWLVDPLGRLFFSSGVAVVQNANPTMVTGRETMFLEFRDSAARPHQGWLSLRLRPRQPLSQVRP
jgi:hypothetical protein